MNYRSRGCVITGTSPVKPSNTSMGVVKKKKKVLYCTKTEGNLDYFNNQMCKITKYLIQYFIKKEFSYI